MSTVAADTAMVPGGACRSFSSLDSRVLLRMLPGDRGRHCRRPPLLSYQRPHSALSTPRPVFLTSSSPNPSAPGAHPTGSSSRSPCRPHARQAAGALSKTTQEALQLSVTLPPCELQHRARMAAASPSLSRSCVLPARALHRMLPACAGCRCIACVHGSRAAAVSCSVCDAWLGAVCSTLSVFVCVLRGGCVCPCLLLLTWVAGCTLEVVGIHI